MSVTSGSQPQEQCKKRSIDFVWLRAVLLCLALMIAPTIGMAHSGGSRGASTDGSRGLEIPAITHSDMIFVAPHYSAIVRLAEKQKDTDERFRRLLNHTKLQKVYCLWGLAPGGIAEEESIFNPCSHAYLASGVALLRDMESKAATEEEAVAISRSIEVERSAAPLLVLCQSSAETFDTGELVSPISRMAAMGWLSVMAFATLLAARAVRYFSSRLRNGTPG